MYMKLLYKAGFKKKQEERNLSIWIDQLWYYKSQTIAQEEEVEAEASVPRPVSGQIPSLLHQSIKSCTADLLNRGNRN
jgi:hypothetical protein